MDKKTLNTMFDNLLHIGNKTNFWNPKMKEYIYGSVNGIHVLNLIKTTKELEQLKVSLKELATQGKKILFVATKLQARDAFAKLAEETGHYYVSEKWVPGLLTNFKTIKRRIATYLKLLKDSESGAMDVLTKKEKAARLLELEKLDKAFKWLKEMKKSPDIIFAVDGAFEAQALKEAKSLNLPAFAMLNTNGNPDMVEGFVPANTNSVKSVEYIASELKSVLAGIKVAAQPRNAIRKTEDRRPSARRTPSRDPSKRPETTTKKVEAKAETKVEVKKETKTEEK